MNTRITDAGHWMPTKPMATLLSCFVALLTIPIAAVVVAQTQWTYLERFYVSSYLKSGLASRLGLSDKPYDQVLLSGNGREFFATKNDVEATHDIAGTERPTLTPAARAAGFRDFAIARVRVPNAEMHRRLATHIYEGRGVLQLAQMPLLGGAAVLLVLLCWSVPTDVRRARERRQGARLRGSELVTIAEFNRRIREA